MSEHQVEEPTKLERLTDAIREYVESLDDHEQGAVLSGFVLAWQETMIVLDDRYLPLQSSSDFVLGAGTTLELGIGLAQATRVKLENELFTDDEDEDDV